MRVFVVTKKSGIIYGLVLIFLISVIYIGRNETALVASTQKDLPIYCVAKDENDKTVSISFDAAWGNEDTQQLIDILAKYKVKTTFFVVGSWVDKYPESVKALHDAGHEIMNHSNTHPHMANLSVEEIKREAEECGKKIENVTGVKPNLFRVPYGEYNNRVVQSLRESGYSTIQWDVDSLDWKDLPAAEITQRIVPKVKPGSIVLFHNAAKNTPEALPGIIEQLQDNGYSIVPISKLIIKGDHYIDPTGMQHSGSASAAAPTSSASTNNPSASATPAISGGSNRPSPDVD